MDMTAAPSKDVTGEKPAAGFFGSRGWRIVRNSLVGVLATLFIIWLVLFITKGRFLKRPFESVTAALRKARTHEHLATVRRIRKSALA